MTDPPKLPPVLAGWPWKREVMAVCACASFRWVLQAAFAGIQIDFLEGIGNQVGISRSQIIHATKTHLDKVGPEGFILTMMDSDAKPITPAVEALPFVLEDFAKGAGLVVAPCHTIYVDSEDNVVTIKEDWGDAEGAVQSATEPWEIAWSSFTWVFINPELIRKLTAPHSWKNLNGGEVPLYTWTGPDTSEDTRLCHRTREAGFRTVADPRIKVRHRKEIDSPEYEGPQPQPA